MVTNPTHRRQQCKMPINIAIKRARDFIIKTCITSNINNKYPRKASAAGGKRKKFFMKIYHYQGSAIELMAFMMMNACVLFNLARNEHLVRCLALCDVGGWQISLETTKSCIAHFSTLAEVSLIMQLNFLDLISKTSERNLSSPRNIFHETF